MSDSEKDYDEEMEEESEEGECESGSDEDDENDECDPTGLFDALAAARQSGENLINHEMSRVDESCKLPDEYLIASYTTALKLSWKTQDSSLNEPDVVEKSWREGERVMAKYYEDGISYKAKILQLKQWKKAAVVRFYEYDNEEEVSYSDLAKLDKKPSKKVKKRPLKKHRKARYKVKSDQDKMQS